MKWALTKRLIENDLAIEAVIFNTKIIGEDIQPDEDGQRRNDSVYDDQEELAEKSEVSRKY